MKQPERERELTGGMDHRAAWDEKRRQAHRDLVVQGYKLVHDDEQKSIYHHPALGFHEVMNQE